MKHVPTIRNATGSENRPLVDQVYTIVTSPSTTIQREIKCTAGHHGCEAFGKNITQKATAGKSNAPKTACNASAAVQSNYTPEAKTSAFISIIVYMKNTPHGATVGGGDTACFHWLNNTDGDNGMGRVLGTNLSTPAPFEWKFAG